MQRTLETLQSEIEVMDPISTDGFQLFGLKRLRRSELSYLTFDEALRDGLIDITEINESGSVPELKLWNHADRLVFLMSGEELQGAKQNRVLNVSIMVGARSDISIPVSCVEAGRWRYTSRKFSSSGTAAHSFLRAKMSKDITNSYRMLGVPRSNQTNVWQEISRKLGKMASRSPSEALNQIYMDYESLLNKTMDALKVPTGASGCVFVSGGRIVGMDLFDQPRTFEKLWLKLLPCYVIDVIEESNQSANLTREDVAAWLKTALVAKAEKFDSPGLGDDVRLEGENLAGAALLLQGEAVHTEMFCIDETR